MAKKILARVKKWFDVKSEDAFRLEDIEELRHAIQKQEEALSKIKQSRNKSKSELQLVQSKKENAAKELSEIKRLSIIAREKSDEQSLKELMKLHKSTKITFDALTANEASMQEIVKKFEDSMNNLEHSYTTNKAKYNVLKMKADYSKNIKGYCEVLNDIEGFDGIDGAMDGIEVDFTKTNLDLEDLLTNSDNVMANYSAEAEYEDFLKSIDAEIEKK